MPQPHGFLPEQGTSSPVEVFSTLLYVTLRLIRKNKRKRDER